MSEGLSSIELGQEVVEHVRRLPGGHHDGWAIAEAVVLSVVTLVAAWSGYAAAKWNTESRLEVAHASTHHSEAGRAFQRSITLRTWDASAFNAWFSAYIAGDEKAAEVARRRFRPEYRVAFDAWLATSPFTNPNAPPGPQNMAQYRPQGAAEAAALDAKGDAEVANSEHAGDVADDYIRTTVVLASVLFLVGIGGHFPRRVRIGLLGLSTVLLLAAATAILRLPVPP
ncbi:MAG: hypothetical protein ACJ74M_04660 [Gaiellaceae bacterium]